MTTASLRPDMPDLERVEVNTPLGDLLRTRPVVVAVSGDADGEAPVRVAAAIASHFHTSVSAIQVLDVSAIPAPLPWAFGLAHDLIGEEPYHEDVITRRRQFAGWLGKEVDWPVCVEVGAPAAEIVRHASERDAGLIVLGLRRHGVVDRVLRDETTLNVARRAHSPLLGIVPTMKELPRRAVVGVDFGPASTWAARLALDVLAAGATANDPARLRLLYVDANAEIRDTTTGRGVIARRGVTAAFHALLEQLAAPPTVHVEWTIRIGAPSEALLAYADETDADLIAVGSVRHERLDAFFLGTVTTEVVRDGRCSVLVIPPSLSGP